MMMMMTVMMMIISTIGVLLCSSPSEDGVGGDLRPGLLPAVRLPRSGVRLWLRDGGAVCLDADRCGDLSADRVPGSSSRQSCFRFQHLA